jgi:hypothetical protein
LRSGWFHVLALMTSRRNFVYQYFVNVGADGNKVFMKSMIVADYSWIYLSTE